jgi:tRNA-specific 2-thiouridylase
VISIDQPKNRVVVGPQEDLLRKEFTAAGVNWIAPEEVRTAKLVRAEVRIRHRHQESPATITPLPSNHARIVFDEPQRAITPGQATIFYRGDEVLGGGWITK